MRVRTGHGPKDWTDNIPGCHAAVTGHGGTLVQGDSGKVDRDRVINREKARRKAARPVDLNDYPRENRYDRKPRCGVMMARAGQPCGRMPGHRDDHKTAAAVEAERARRRKVA